MNTTEHLELIKAYCLRNLEIAAKRTPGEWQMAARMELHDIIGNDGICGGVYIASVTGKSWGAIDPDVGIMNAQFIALCAGAAEAGWKATIVAIRLLLLLDVCGNFSTEKEVQKTINEILAAYPLNLIQP